MNSKGIVDKIKEDVSDVFELPKEITLNLPKVVLIGDLQVRVENHKGIIEYHSSKIRVNTKIGILVIRGDNLFIRNIIKEEVVIEGKVTSISLGE